MKTFVFAWWLAANGADAVSTEVALRRPNVVEVNPVMQGGTSERLLVRGAVTAGVTALALKAYPKHPKIVGWTLGALSTEFTVLAVHNMRQY